MKKLKVIFTVGAIAASAVLGSMLTMNAYMGSVSQHSTVSTTTRERSEALAMKMGLGAATGASLAYLAVCLAVRDEKEKHEITLQQIAVESKRRKELALSANESITWGEIDTLLDTYKILELDTKNGKQRK